MIVPQARLLFWVAGVILPFATLAGVYEPAALICIGVIGLLVAVVLLDAVLSLGALKGIRLKAPETVRVSKERQAQLNLQIGNSYAPPHPGPLPRGGRAGPPNRRLRIGLSLPPQIASANDSLEVLLPPDAEWSQLPWPFTATRRGNFDLTRAYVEANSPLGFWAHRSALPLNSQIRVYPNLLNERKNLAALFLNRGNFGIHAQPQVGQGREFEKLREYIPGDSYDEVHWKATAKRGHPITKVFQIERTQQIYVVIDASRLSARASFPNASDSARCRARPRPSSSSSTDAQNRSANSRTRTKDEDEHEMKEPISTTVLERYITAALVLGLAAERQGDLFGLLTFSDKIESFVRAKNGKVHYDACRDAIYTLEPRAVTPDYDELASFIRLHLRRRALLMIFTALDDPVLAESFVRNMNLLSRQHLVLVNMIKPRRLDPLFSHVDVQTTDDLYDELRGHLQWQSLREVQKVLQRRGVQFSLLENERLSAELVTQYINVKQRQLL